MTLIEIVLTGLVLLGVVVMILAFERSRATRIEDDLRDQSRRGHGARDRGTRRGRPDQG